MNSKKNIVYMFVFMLGVAVVTSLDSTNITELVLEQYLRLCPLTDTCMTNRSEERNNSTETLGGPNGKHICCYDCSCSESCGSDCCPDKIGEEIQELQYEECVYAQYRPFVRFAFNGRAFNMITKCPMNYTIKQSYTDNCEANIFDRVPVVVSMLVPVSSRVTQNSYKNKFCALCHGEDERNLHTWNASFACRKGLYMPPASFEDILDEAKRRRDCNILYSPGGSGIVVERCTKTIDTCNVTGEWQEYDAVMEAACHSYRSIYAKNYKNVHCYMCNNDKSVYGYIHEQPICYDYVPPIIRGDPFSAVLDFNRLLAPETKVKALCPHEHVFDKEKNKCRHLWCNHGLNLLDDSCGPLYLQIDGEIRVSYNFQLALFPAFIPDNGLLDFSSDIWNVFNQILHTLLASGAEICSIQSFVKLKYGLQEFVDSINHTNENRFLQYIDYIAYDFVLSDEGVKDVQARISELEHEVKQVYISNFTVEYRNLSSITLALLDGSMENNKTAVSHVNITNVQSHELPGWLNVSLFSAFEYDTYGILPLNPRIGPRCLFSFTITFQPFCPRLIFYKNEINISTDNTIVSVLDTKLNLNRSGVLFSENGDYFSICKHDYQYLSHIEKVENVSSYRPLTVVTIICTSVSIISLIITLSVYCMFPVLRSLPGLNNMGLVVSLLVFFTLMLINASTEVVHPGVCTAIAVTLHAAVLSTFSWMFVCTWHMARVFSSMNSRAHHRDVIKQFIHYVVYAEGTTAIIISATLFIPYFISGTLGYADRPCFVSPDILIYAVAIPIAIVVLLNFAMFIYVVATIIKLPDVQKNNKNERHYIEIFMKLSTLTGLTWLFGFVYQFTALEVFSYIFTVLNASQGVLIMFSFVINKRVYNMCRGRTSGKRASTGKSTPRTNSTDFTGTHL